jgi:hypothetical protein
LQVRRDDDVMTLTPIDDPWRILSPDTRITRVPADLAEQEDLCAGKESKFIEEMIKSVKR